MSCSRGQPGSRWRGSRRRETSTSTPTHRWSPPTSWLGGPRSLEGKLLFLSFHVDIVYVDLYVDVEHLGGDNVGGDWAAAGRAQLLQGEGSRDPREGGNRSSKLKNEQNKSAGLGNQLTRTIPTYVIFQQSSFNNNHISGQTVATIGGYPGGERPCTCAQYQTMGGGGEESDNNTRFEICFLTSKWYCISNFLSQGGRYLQELFNPYGQVPGKGIAQWERVYHVNFSTKLISAGKISRCNKWRRLGPRQR